MYVARTALALLALAAVVMLAGCGGDPAFTSGKVYLQQRDYENAIEQLKLAIRNSPNFWEPHMWLGRAYAETDQLELAHEELFRAKEMAPGEGALAQAENAIAYYAQAYRKEGFNYIDAAQYEQAIVEYEKALIIDPTHADSHAGLGVSYQNMGDYDMAIESFRAALELNPDSEILKEYLLGAYEVKAASLDAQDNWAGAIEYYRLIEEVDPGYPNIKYNIGYMHYLLEHWREAIRYFEAYLEVNPEDPDVPRFVVYSYWKQAEELWDVDQELATTYYERTIELLYEMIDSGEDTVSNRRMLHRIFTKLGRTEEAAAELEQVRLLLEAGSE